MPATDWDAISSPVTASDWDAISSVDKQSPIGTAGGPQHGRVYRTDQQRSAEGMRQWNNLPWYARATIAPDEMVSGGIEARNAANADAGAVLINTGLDSTANLPGNVLGFAAKVAGQVGRNFDPSIDPSTWRSAVAERTTIPGTSRGNEITGQLVAPVSQAWEKNVQPILNRHPLLGALTETAGTALEGVGLYAGAKTLTPTVRNAVTKTFTKPATLAAEDVLARQSARSATNQGAAAASPSLANVSPEIKQAVVAAGKNGVSVNNEALQRHVQADTLPVKVQLTKGQATQSPLLISQEQNMKGAHPKIGARLNEQNQQLIENVQAIRDQVGPEVFTTNATEHGDALIQAYKIKDEALQTDIRAKYKALADANGGSLPVDGQAFVAQAAQNLKQGMKAPFLPSPVRKLVAQFRTQPMTMENFENLRTTLATAGRAADRAGDGNAGAAISAVRDALEDLPIQPGRHIVMEGDTVTVGDPAAFKKLADEARSAARARFQALREDPAYKAAVDDKVPADKFVQRFIIGGHRDKLEVMQRNLAHDPVAKQTIGVAALDHLRQAARIGPDWNGNFAQAGFNKALQQLSPKIQHLLDPATQETLQNLGDVARYTQFQPRGSFVNNSNTFTAAAADYGAKTAEGVINVAAHGVPVGTWVGKAARHLKSGKLADQILAPGAGISK